MSQSIKLSQGMHSPKCPSQDTLGWLGKHKVEIIGGTLAIGLTVAAIAAGFLTAGTATIICCAILGTTALAAGTGTAGLSVKHHVTEIKERKLQQAEEENRKKEALVRRGNLHGFTLTFVGATTVFAALAVIAVRILK